MRRPSTAALFATAIALAAPAQAAPGALDFHRFEAAYGATGTVSAGMAVVRAALPVGADGAQALAMLRGGGARCPSRLPMTGDVGCYYREQVSTDDYTATYATWDVRIALADGRIGAVAVERTTEQR